MMIFLLQVFTAAVALCVIALLLIPLAVIWETKRTNKEFRKLEHPRRGEGREPERTHRGARGMTTVEVSGPEVLERWKSEARANCAPLYIQDALLFDGHDASTKNATATFVKFKGRYYACTCQHVVDIANKRREMLTTPFATLALGLKEGFINLSFNTVAVAGPGEGQQDYLDLAIADISRHWELLTNQWGNCAIEMDHENWREPRWARAKLLAAAGWPETRKRIVTVNGSNRVRGTFAFIIADVSGGVSRHDEITLMHSRFDTPHGWYFSGVSGGPMYVVQGDRIISAGLLYAGWPQTPEDRQDGLTPNDIMIRGVTLTPNNFEKWLLRANLK